MDSTETARRRAGNDAAPRSYAELTSGYAGHPPIYAALVAEWEARGHTVPEHRDGQWVSFAAPAESETWTAVTAWTAGRPMGQAIPAAPHPAAASHRATGPHSAVGRHPATGPHSAAGPAPAPAPHAPAGRHPGPAAPAGSRPGSGRHSGVAGSSSGGARLTSRPSPPAPR
ncbi:hypothetical protein ACFZDI_15065 [Streptomyces sp. NPDC007907]|uniref:hypothetical protein n=1 Tax=Streptomyces sp. NPDC007907 TaxID=3364789 RepID=UPI0036EEB636